MLKRVYPSQIVDNGQIGISPGIRKVSFFSLLFFFAHCLFALQPHNHQTDSEMIYGEFVEFFFFVQLKIHFPIQIRYIVHHPFSFTFNAQWSLSLAFLVFWSLCLFTVVMCKRISTQCFFLLGSLFIPFSFFFSFDAVCRYQRFFFFFLSPCRASMSFAPFLLHIFLLSSFFSARLSNGLKESYHLGIDRYMRANIWMCSEYFIFFSFHLGSYLLFCHIWGVFLHSSVLWNLSFQSLIFWCTSPL